MGKIEELVKQRSVSCPSCGARENTVCVIYAPEFHPRRGQGLKYNHVTRVNKYNRIAADRAALARS